MKKVVILGCENSHADTFLGFIANDKKTSRTVLMQKER